MKASTTEKTRKPHIVLFNPDQFRADALYHLGNPASHTPNFDKLTETDGISFRNAFCQNPVCTPSRCSFMSGWYPHVAGHRTMYHMMRPDEPVMLKTLKENGYFVWWGGKNDLVPGDSDLSPYCDVKFRPRPNQMNPHSYHSWRGERSGDNWFSFYTGKLDVDEEGNYHDGDDCNVRGAVDLIQDYDGDKPLCIYLPLSNPHPPYAVEEPYYSLVDRNKVPKHIPTPDWSQKPKLLGMIKNMQRLENWTDERFTELRATYLGMCARIDAQYGMLEKALKEKGIYDDTAIFVFSDHGDFTGDYGLVEKTQNTFEDCLTNVPFLIKPPSNMSVNPGIRDGLTELIDLYPTVMEIAGIEFSHTQFGKSLIPFFEDSGFIGRDAVFCEGGRLENEIQASESDSVQDDPEMSLYWPRLHAQTTDYIAHTKATMCRTNEYKYVKRFYEQDEFYNLRLDPQELSNEINNPEYKEIILEFKERMLNFYMETCDVVPIKTDKR